MNIQGHDISTYGKETHDEELFCNGKGEKNPSLHGENNSSLNKKSMLRIWWCVILF